MRTITTLPSPFVSNAGEFAHKIVATHDNSFPSGIADRAAAKELPLLIYPSPTLSMDVAITAFKAPYLDAGAEILQTLPLPRSFTYKSVMADTLSPGQVTGHPMPLFFNISTLHEQRMQAFGMQGHDTHHHTLIESLSNQPNTVVPIIGMIETAWSETIKTIDQELSDRFMMWSYSIHSAKRKNPNTPFTLPEPPLAAFFVRDEQKFLDMVHRYMPFTRSSLLVP